MTWLTVAPPPASGLVGLVGNLQTSAALAVADNHHQPTQELEAKRLWVVVEARKEFRRQTRTLIIVGKPSLVQVSRRG
jgi:hypothetical protein